MHLECDTHETKDMKNIQAMLIVFFHEAKFLGFAASSLPCQSTTFTCLSFSDASEVCGLSMVLQRNM